MTTRSAIARRAAVLAALLGVLAGASPASAAPLEKGRFEESGTEVLEDLCGDLDVVHNWHVTGNFLGRVKGSDGLAYYRDRNQGTNEFINPLTGKSYSNVFVSNNRDRQVVDNGDGTLTIHVQGSGTEHWYDGNGKLVLMNPGNFRFEILVDNAGTPSDPFDDEFIEFVDVDRESTGRNDLDGRDFCEDLLQFAV
jgi:hypothetical protein